MISSEKIHPSDLGLPETAIRKRRHSRRLARIMLTIAVATAIVGWGLFGSSIFSAIRIQDQPPSLALVAYGLLIVSSVTLVLGLWYLLLAQVERLARMVEAEPGELSKTVPATHCQNCGWGFDSPDHFCRHC